jgi:sulfur carrier protein ThiS adenylyltransferase
MSEPTRHSRQASALPPEAANTPITIVGVGAIGRQIALQLAASGFTDITIFDDDTVDIVNLGPQAFKEADVGRLKVDAVADDCKALNSQCTVKKMPIRYNPDHLNCQVMFCCVDSIDTRATIFQSLNRAPPKLFIDSRMSAEVSVTITIEDCTTDAIYDKTLFPGSDAFTGPCTMRSTIYCSNIAAGMAIASFSKWLRKIPADPYVMFYINQPTISFQIPPK